MSSPEMNTETPRQLPIPTSNNTIDYVGVKHPDGSYTVVWLYERKLRWRHCEESDTPAEMVCLRDIANKKETVLTPPDPNLRPEDIG
jgi:hypothetical protein